MGLPSVLFQYLSELGATVEVARNDRITIDEIERLGAERIVISPGPSTPLNAGISNDVVRHFGARLPVLGVCLGHQCVGYSYGGSVVSAQEIMHGKSSPVYHNDTGILRGLPNPFPAIRYHSLAVDREGLPDCLEITAWTDDDTIMALRHRQHPVESVSSTPSRL